MTRTSVTVDLEITTPQDDGTVWLGGQGQWEDGATPGAPTFNTLAAIVDSIDPITGGWAQIPGTKLIDHLVPRSVVNAIDPRIWQVSGSSAVTKVWGGGSFNGKALRIGCIGGHLAYAGNEMYAVRVTDPPAAVRMYDPSPLTADSDPNQPTTVWGPDASHTYGGTFWSPEIGRHILCVHGRGIWALDHNAATPKAAWSKIAATGASSYPACARYTDTEFYIYNNTFYTSRACNYQTGMFRDLGANDAPFPGGLMFSSDYNYPFFAREAGILFHSVLLNGVGHVRTYDAATRTANAADAGSRLPDWVGGQVRYRTITGTPDGKFALFWQGDHKIACYDRLAHTVREFLISGLNSPVYPDQHGFNGVHTSFAPIEVGGEQVFLGLNSVLQDMHVFRPPQAWGIQ